MKNIIHVLRLTVLPPFVEFKNDLHLADGNAEWLFRKFHRVECHLKVTDSALAQQNRRGIALNHLGPEFQVLQPEVL